MSKELHEIVIFPNNTEERNWAISIGYLAHNGNLKRLSRFTDRPEIEMEILEKRIIYSPIICKPPKI